jgi:O-antigen ligase
MSGNRLFLNVFNLGVLLFSVSVLLPFNFRNIPFLIFSLVAIYFFCKPKLNSQKKYLKILIINILYFVFMLISIFYTDNFSEGTENLLSISPMLIMPLTFYAVFTRNNIKHALIQNRFYKLFFISTILFFSAILIYSLFQGFFTKTYLLHYPERITVKFGKYSMHPLYASILVVISLIFSTSIYKTLKKSFTKVLFFISIAFLFCQLILLARKGPILISAIIFIVYFISLKNRKALGCFILTLIIFIILIFSNQLLKERFYEFISVILNPDLNNLGSTSTRLRIYNFSLEAISKAPIFGYGIGDVKDVLSKFYIENNSTYFNSHNQFLGAWLSCGIMGFVSLLSIFVFGFKKAVKSRDFIYFSVLFLFFTMALIENFIEKQNGILLFSFLLNFFAFKEADNYKKKEANAK